MRCEDRFHEIYGRDPEGLSFSPYRICPIGAHSDHNLGKITGLAIDKGIHIAYAPKQNGVVEMTSLQFPKRAQWHIASVPERKQEDWADYLRGDDVMYVQVALQLSSQETCEREFGNMKQIKDNYPKYVVTMDPNVGLIHDSGIVACSAREFLLAD